MITPQVISLDFEIDPSIVVTPELLAQYRNVILRACGTAQMDLQDGNRGSDDVGEDILLLGDLLEYEN